MIDQAITLGKLHFSSVIIVFRYSLQPDYMYGINIIFTVYIYGSVGSMNRGQQLCSSVSKIAPKRLNYTNYYLVSGTNLITAENGNPVASGEHYYIACLTCLHVCRDRGRVSKEVCVLCFVRTLHSWESSKVWCVEWSLF